MLSITGKSFYSREQPGTWEMNTGINEVSEESRRWMLCSYDECSEYSQRWPVAKSHVPRIPIPCRPGRTMKVTFWGPSHTFTSLSPHQRPLSVNHYLRCALCTPSLSTVSTGLQWSSTMLLWCWVFNSRTEHKLTHLGDLTNLQSLPTGQLLELFFIGK